MTSEISCRKCKTTFVDSNEKERHVEFIHRLEVDIAFENGLY